MGLRLQGIDTGLLFWAKRQYGTGVAGRTLPVNTSSERYSRQMEFSKPRRSCYVDMHVLSARLALGRPARHSYLAS